MSEKSGYTKAIILNNREIALHELLSHDFEVKSEFEQQVRSYIIDWFSDKKEFEFKTSGSTGKRKSIFFNREKVIQSILRTSSFLNLSEKDVAYLCLPLHGTGGKMMLARALHLNMSLVCTDPTSNPFYNLQDRITFIAATPQQVNTGFQDLIKIKEWKALLIGGAPISPRLQRLISKNISSPTYLSYGMTETLSHIALKRLDTNESYYSILPGVQIDTNSKDAMMVKADVTEHKWIETTDQVKILSNRTFEWLGRSDFVINSGGIKIHPEQVEKKLSPLLTGNNFIITSLPDETLGQQCVLVIEGTQNNFSTDDLNPKIRDKVGGYEMPKKILFLENFIYTSSGKIDRTATQKLI